MIKSRKSDIHAVPEAELKKKKKNSVGIRTLNLQSYLQWKIGQKIGSMCPIRPPGNFSFSPLISQNLK